MTRLHDDGREAARITCMAHPLLVPSLTTCFEKLGLSTVLVESARCVRQRVRRRVLLLPGDGVDFIDSPMSLFRITVRRDNVAGVLAMLAESGDFTTPGRGTLFVQDVVEYGASELPEGGVPPETVPLSGLLHDLTLLTGILSMAGSGELFARIALRLGACVPVIGRGRGTGIRDRLGLLRITIPPVKEIIHLIVPAQDADGIQRLLIEDGRLARPGGGFLYQTPIRAARVDTLLRIGRQAHAASIEQIIAAVDELKGGTSWRRRYAELGASRRTDIARRHYHEISFVCGDGNASEIAQEAVRAGASGVTMSRIRDIGMHDMAAGGAACERGVVCVPDQILGRVLTALKRAAPGCGARALHIQILTSPSVFTYQHAP